MYLVLYSFERAGLVQTNQTVRYLFCPHYHDMIWNIVWVSALYRIMARRNMKLYLASDMYIVANHTISFLLWWAANDKKKRRYLI